MKPTSVKWQTILLQLFVLYPFANGKLVPFTMPNLLDNKLEAELLSKLVVPGYVQMFADHFFLGNNGTRKEYSHSNPYLDMLFDGVDNEDCKAHVWELLLISADRERLLREDNKWAMQMLDSWGKVPEGILRGHVNMIGDFDECIGVKVKNISISSKNFPNSASLQFEGRYCTVYLSVSKNQSMSSLTGSEEDRPISRGRKTTRSNDVTGIHLIGLQIIPSVGICLPNSCSKNDVQLLMENGLSIFQKVDGTIPANKFPQPITFACYEERKPDFDGFDIAVITITTAVTALCIVTGSMDWWLSRTGRELRTGSQFNNYLAAFSAYRNCKDWLNTRSAPGDFGCLHGIRFLSMAWVISGHTIYLMGLFPHWDMVNMVQLFQEGTWLAVASSTFCVDSFFVMSGMLVCHGLMHQFQKSNGKLQIPKFYIKRYLRLTPTYAILLGIMTTFVPHMGNGPYWASVDNLDKACKTTWWVNLLYVNNLVETDSLCMGESWYVANDMQFYILSPFIIFPMWRWEMVGVLLLFIYTVLSCVTPALLVYFLEVTPIVIPSRREGNTYFSQVYSQPYARISTYLVGIWLGWIIFKTKGKKLKLRAGTAPVLWLCSLLVTITLLYGIHPWYDPNYEISQWERLSYAGLSRLAWGGVVAWTIFACVKGLDGGIIDRFLSWKLFRPLGRLCFCVYLSSLHMQRVIYMRRKQLVQYDPYMLVHNYLAFLMMSFMVGFVLWLFFEAPFLALQKLYFGGGSTAIGVKYL